MAARANTTNQPSTPKAPRPPIKSAPSTLVSASASLTGTHPVIIGANAIIQVRSRLSSVTGAIDIGEGCIVAERACIGLSPVQGLQDDENGRGAEAGVKLAKGVLIESGAVVEAASIGAYTVIEAGAKVGRGAVVGERCRICPKVTIGEGEVIGDRVVVYGSGFGERRVERRDGVIDERRERWIEEQGQALRKLWTGK